VPWLVGRLLANRTASAFSGVAGMPRNQGLACVGITGCFASECPAGIRRTRTPGRAPAVEPAGQGPRVLLRNNLAEAEGDADLGAVVLDRTALPGVAARRPRGHADLGGDGVSCP